MDATFAYSCLRDDSIIPKAYIQKKFDCFYFLIRFCNNLKKPAEGGGDADNNVVVLSSFHRGVSADRCRLEEEDLRPLLSTFMRNALLPASIEGSILDDVFTLAHSMANDERNAGKVLPIFVDIVATTLQIPGESEDEAVARYRAARDEMVTYNFVPATKSSIEALE